MWVWWDTQDVGVIQVDCRQTYEIWGSCRGGVWGCGLHAGHKCKEPSGCALRRAFWG